MNYEPLSSLNFQAGINPSAAPLSPASKATLSDSSYNAVVSGDGYVRPWTGATSQGVNSGSRKMCPFGNTWGGIANISYADKTFSAPAAVGTNQVTVTSTSDYLTGIPCTVSTGGTLPTGLVAATPYWIIVVDATHIAFAASLADALLNVPVPITAATGSGTITIDVANASITASGSWLQDIGLSRWGIGAGQPKIAGTSVPGFQLSTNLQVQIPVAGVFGPPVQAGLGQPSAPEVGVVALTGLMSNSMSVKISRSRPATGAVSLASETSLVVIPQASRIRVTFPTAATGQTHWRVFFPFQGFGGTGVHYLGSYNSEQDIAESVVAATSVDGIARSLEFNFQDADLIPIEASFDDYPPPAATQAIRLNTVMNLVGCYADSASDPTTGNTGTCIAVSKENNYESYVPTSLLYLPEQVVDVLARPLDDYGYIGCQNSIHAIQYVGNRGDELPSCTITTILPDVGIQYLYNWCHFRGQLLIYTAQGSLILMDGEGQFDTSFANDVAKILRGWTPVDTSVGYDPSSDSIVVMNGKRMLVYSLQKGQWRQIWLPDFGLTGTGVSSVAAQRQLFFTLLSGGISTAYTYGTNTLNAPLSFVTNMQNFNGSVVNDIYEMAVSAETGIATKLGIVINRNLSRTGFRQISTIATNPVVIDADGGFTSDMVGKKFLLFGTNMGGGGTLYLQGTVAGYTNKTDITLSVAPAVTLSDCFMLVGDFASVSDISQVDQLPNFFPNLPELRSFAVGCWLQGGQGVGNILSVDLIGATYASSRAK